ncbi:c-type cytochrome [Haloflavibacter putidus]|uniref:Cytochrome c n=1 Tax=Haloflavibacter putidus TaxID=2576776 RepID=A0A507ZVN9_9FLAO|nr:cytochrome c [Haloflavibacter putidus]TQD39758.1 cytochrome c [Haloflavibacter putidus]
MKNYLKLSFLLLAFSGILIGCGGEKKKDEKKEKVTLHSGKDKKDKKEDKKSKVPASERVALDNKGVGPIKNVDLAETVDQDLASKGKDVYNKMCTACHKPTKRFIGPAPAGILERRSPEWVMNMILAPEKMVREDPLAKDLLIEFNGSPMANQGLTEEEARAVLEYFRTL